MRIRTVASIAALSLATGALAGCGGSSHGTTVTQLPTPTTQPAQQTPLQSNTDVGHSGGQQRAKPGHSTTKHVQSDQGQAVDPIHVQKAHQTPATTSDEHNGTGGPPNPCRLVSLPEAKTITGGAIVSKIEAPLGPTCIYKQANAQASVTLAVETLNFAQATRQMGLHKRAVTISGRRAYCARVGTQALLVPLSGGRLLSVTAPCSIAQRFAAKALSRLSA